ncbi:LemA family protein [Mesonia sp. HuA40]|uniref:LemA family protein n=1 Tax=Mesonia sp. HuA40 TaxID=2602761 RepID=UPI0011C8A414|nr:LemA family protein [Mesonia sp. HuA40]TXK73233.1 LemA family protein [Mesonia sp. HuA40]
MKKWLIPVIVIAIIGFIAYSLFGGTYNTAVEKQEEAKTAWSNVENAYQRRNDLIPNLVNTVKGAADFEQETLTQVIQARAKATSVNIDADNLSPEAIANFQQAQDGLSSAISKLLVSVERYPELKATQNYQQLQSQLEGTENRINVERKRYNEAVKLYNTFIRKFPNNLVVGFFGFDKMTAFEAVEGAEQAPTVEF